MAAADMRTSLVGITSGNGQEVDPTFLAGRVGLRPLDHNLNNYSGGHYRLVTFSGAVNTISANGILADLRWASSTANLVLLRLAMNVEIVTAITTASVLDAKAYIFRGSTATGSGSGSSTATISGNSQKKRATMGTSLFGSAGEIRTIGTTTALIAPTGATNDANPFGAAFWGCLFNTSATGTAVLVSPGAAMSGGWQDLFNLSSPYEHPIVLTNGEGVEVQVITANNTSGTIKYGFLWDFAEVNPSSSGF